MKVIFLGTGAGRPTLARNVTSAALELQEPTPRYWLFDAGEGTQQQLLRRKLKLNKVERIFITHLHGDHLYGLPGILTSRSYFEGAGPLQLYGPVGLREYVNTVLRLSGALPDYELTITELEDGGERVVAEDERFVVEAASLAHRIASFGYRIVERPRPGRLKLDLLTELGVPPGPIYGQLKKGQDVTLECGRTLRGCDVVSEPSRGRIVAILGDTTPCDYAVRLGRDADLLVHEATFAAGLEAKASDYGHSTVRQAAETAARAGARRLVLTHFSARYDDEAVERMMTEVSDVFPDVLAARDFLEIEVPESRPE